MPPNLSDDSGVSANGGGDAVLRCSFRSVASPSRRGQPPSLRMMSPAAAAAASGCIVSRVIHATDVDPPAYVNMLQRYFGAAHHASGPDRGASGTSIASQLSRDRVRVIAFPLLAPHTTDGNRMAHGSDHSSHSHMGVVLGVLQICIPVERWELDADSSGRGRQLSPHLRRYPPTESFSKSWDASDADISHDTGLAQEWITGIRALSTVMYATVSTAVSYWRHAALHSLAHARLEAVEQQLDDEQRHIMDLTARIDRDAGVQQLSRDVSQCKTLAELCGVVSEQAGTLVPVEACAVFIQQGDQLYSPAVPHGLTHPKSLPCSQGLTGAVYTSRQALVLNHNPFDDGRFRTEERLVPGRVHSVGLFPVKDSDGEVVAVLHVENRRAPERSSSASSDSAHNDSATAGFSEHDIEVLDSVAGCIWLALDRLLVRASTGSQLLELRNQHDALTAEVETLRSAKGSVERELGGATETVQRLTADVEALQRGIADLRSSLDASRDKTASAEHQLGQIEDVCSQQQAALRVSEATGVDAVQHDTITQRLLAEIADTLRCSQAVLWIPRAAQDAPSGPSAAQDHQERLGGVPFGRRGVMLHAEAASDLSLRLPAPVSASSAAGAVGEAAELHVTVNLGPAFSGSPERSQSVQDFRGRGGSALRLGGVGGRSSRSRAMSAAASTVSGVNGFDTPTPESSETSTPYMMNRPSSTRPPRTGRRGRSASPFSHSSSAADDFGLQTFSSAGGPQREGRISYGGRPSVLAVPILLPESAHSTEHRPTVSFNGTAEARSADAAMIRPTSGGRPQLYGVLEFQGGDDHQFTGDDENVARSIAGQLALALALQRSRQELQRCDGLLTASSAALQQQQAATAEREKSIEVLQADIGRLEQRTEQCEKTITELEAQLRESRALAKSTAADLVAANESDAQRADTILELQSQLDARIAQIESMDKQIGVMEAKAQVLHAFAMSPKKGGGASRPDRSRSREKLSSRSQTRQSSRRSSVSETWGDRRGDTSDVADDPELQAILTELASIENTHSQDPEVRLLHLEARSQRMQVLFVDRLRRLKRYIRDLRARLEQAADMIQKQRLAKQELREQVAHYESEHKIVLTALEQSELDRRQKDSEISSLSIDASNNRKYTEDLELAAQQARQDAQTWRQKYQSLHTRVQKFTRLSIAESSQLR